VSVGDDGSVTAGDIAALIAHSGGKLPPPYDADPSLVTKLAKVMQLDIHVVLRGINDLVQARRDAQINHASVQREQEISLKTAATNLSSLLTERRAFLNRLNRQADLWIASYGVDSDSSTDSDASSDESDAGLPIHDLGGGGEIAPAAADAREDAPAAESEAEPTAALLATRSSSRSSISTAQRVSADSSASHLGAGMSTGRGRSEFNAATTLFNRIMLQLPRAQDGIVTLEALFASALNPEQWVGLDDSERRDAEHKTLLELLVHDLQLSEEQAEHVLDDLYTQLRKVFGGVGPRCLGMRSNPEALAAFKADGKTLPDPSFPPEVETRRRSSTGRAAEAASRIAAVRRKRATRSQEDLALALPPFLYLSEIGVLVLFFSPRFVHVLAGLSALNSKLQRHMMEAEAAATDASTNSAASLARERSGRGDRWRARPSPLRLSRPALSSAPLSTAPSLALAPPPSRKIRISFESDSSGHSRRTTTRQAYSASKSEPPSSAAATNVARLLEKTLELFDSSEPEGIDLKEVRRLRRELGDVGAEEIRSLYGQLRRTSAAFAKLAMLSDECRPPAAYGRGGSPSGRDTTISEPHFFVGAAAWVLAAAAESSRDEQASNARVGGSLLKLTSERLSAHDTMALPDGALPNALPGMHVQGDAMGGTAADVKAERIAQLRATFSSRRTLLAVAERIAQRFETGKFSATDRANSHDLLSVLSQTMALPPATSPAMLGRFFASEFSANLLAEKVWAGKGTSRSSASSGEQQAAVILPHAVTWAALEDLLRRQAEALADGAPSDGGGGKRSLGAGLLAAVNGKGGDVCDGTAAKPAFILSINSWKYKLLHNLFLALALFDCLILPVLLAGTRLVGQVRWLVSLFIAVDIFFSFRIGCMFCVSFINDKSVEIFEPRECRRTYLNGECLMDVLTTIPINLLFLATGASSLQIYAIRVPRLVNSRSLYRVYRDWMMHMAGDDVLSGVLATFGVFLIVVHGLTCVMDAIGYDEYFYALSDGNTWALKY
jgi:hypothetical protein